VVPAATSFQEDCGEFFVEGLMMLRKNYFIPIPHMYDCLTPFVFFSPHFTCN